MMKKYLYFILSLLFSIFFYIYFGISEAKSQSSGYKHYTAYDGLIGLQVMNLYEDTKGNIWVFTKQSTAIFDGKKFKTFTPANSALKEQQQFGFLEDTKNGIIYTSSKNYLSVFKDTELIGHFKAKEGMGLSHKIYFSEDSTRIYFAADIDSDNTQIFFDLASESFSYQNIPITDKSISISSAWKPYSLNIPVKNIKILKNTKYHTLNDLYYEKITTLFFDSLYRVNPSLNRPYIDFQPKAYLILSDKEHIIFFIEDNKILCQNLKTNIENMFIFKHKKTTINDIIIDKNKNIWLATEIGLFKLFAQNILSFDKEANMPQMPWVIQEVKPDEYLIGSFQNKDKVGILDMTIKKIKTISYPILNNRNFYFSSVKTKENELVFVSQYGALLYSNNKFSVLDTLQEKMQKKIFKRYYLISHYDSLTGNIAVGGGSFLVFDKNKRVTHALNKKDLEGTLNFPTLNILSIEKIDSDRYLIGSNRGHFWYSLSKEKIERYYFFTEKKSNLSNDYLDKKNYPTTQIITLTKDAWGNIWGGTQNKGQASTLFLYQPQNDSFSFPLAHLKWDFIETVKTIQKGKILVFSQLNQIVLVDLERFYGKSKENYIYVLNKNNGFVGIEPAQNSLMEDTKGRVWFLTGDEKAVCFSFSPDCFDLPALHISNISYSFFDLERLRWEKIGKIPQDGIFTLPKEQRTIALYPQVVTQELPQDVLFRYRLRVESDIWSDWAEAQDSISFSNLKAGRYECEIVCHYKFDSRHINNLEKMTIKFQIKPTFFERKIVMFSIYSLIIILILSIYFHILNHNQIKLKNNLLNIEIEINKRQKEEIEKQKEKIEKINKIIATENKDKGHTIWHTYQEAWAISNQISETLQKNPAFYEYEKEAAFQEKIIALVALLQFSIAQNTLQETLQDVIKRTANYLSKTIIFSEKNYNIDILVDDNGLLKNEKNSKNIRSIIKYNKIIEKVFVNLIKNSFTHAKDENNFNKLDIFVIIKIRIIKNNTDNFLEFSFTYKDNGKGLSEAEIETANRTKKLRRGGKGLKLLLELIGERKEAFLFKPQEGGFGYFVRYERFLD